MVISLVLVKWFGFQPVSIVLFSFTLVFSEFLRREDFPGLFILFTNGAQYVLQLVIFFFASSSVHPPVEHVIFVSILFPFIITVLIRFKVIRVSFKQIFQLKTQDLWVVMKESTGQMLFNLTSVLNNWLGSYLLSFSGTNLDVAIYSAVKRVTRGLSFPEQVLNINFANPLARNLDDRQALTEVLKKQRRLYFIAFIVVAIVGVAVLPFVTWMFDFEEGENWKLLATYGIMLVMILINILTGPTFIYTRLTGRMKQKVSVTMVLTLVLYLLGILPIGHPVINMSISALLSFTSINIYLMLEAYKKDGLWLFATL